MMTRFARCTQYLCMPVGRMVALDVREVRL